MQWTTMFHHKRYVRPLDSLLLSGLALLAALLLLASLRQGEEGAPAALAAQGVVMSATFILDDFDDAKNAPGDPLRKIPRGPNNFFANQGQYTAGGAGALITDSLTCPFTHSCALSLAYDVSAGSNSEGGYVEELGFSYTYSGDISSTWRLRDMSGCEALTFRVKGDNAAPFTTRFEIEFIGHDWGVRDRFTITGITTTWQTKTILLADLVNVEAGRIKQVALRLANNQVTAPAGVLHFDDFAFAGCQVEGDLLDLIERQSFEYFWELRHPKTGFVRDRAAIPEVTSIAAIGFELTAFGIGAERGWITRIDAALATRQVLDSLWAITPTASHNGFYYHLLDIETGEPVSDTELSTIDTALLMAGVLFARQYFSLQSDPLGVDIGQRAQQLFNQVDWRWPLRSEVTPPENKKQFYLAWKPNQEAGFEISAPGGGYFAGTPNDPTTWDYYTDEILLLNLLAIGSSSRAVPADTFTAWRREAGTYDGYTLYQSWFGSLFTHFIGQVWLDLRCEREAMSGVNWQQNSGQAALANRQFAIDQAITYRTYSTQSWGLSASLGPPAQPYTVSPAGIGVYRNYAGLPKGEPIPPPPVHDGTVAPYAAAGSIMFLDRNRSANEAYQALANWYQTQPRLWGLYGFVDSFNLGQNAAVSDDWFAHDYIGIDQGMTLLALENYQTGFVWGVMSSSPVIIKGKRAVFNLDCHNYLPMIQK